MGNNLSITPQAQANQITRAAAAQRVVDAHAKVTEKFETRLAQGQQAAIDNGTYSTEVFLLARHELRGVPREKANELFMQVLAELRDKLQGPEFNLSFTVVDPRQDRDGDLRCDVKLDWSGNTPRSTGPLPELHVPEPRSESPIRRLDDVREEPKRRGLLERLHLKSPGS